MAQKILMEFKRGTGVTHYFQLPRASYVVGSTLFFTAKPAIDNDSLDSKAVINKGFTDSSVVLTTAYATYTLQFDPADLLNILFTDGATELDYVGEFKYVAPGQDPVTFPADDSYIVTRVYADVKLATS